jgi:DNA (cytosine-5)-methyltransferase 1
VATKLNAIDLFSGCGGFSYGFQEAGFNVLLGVDNTEIALKTFKENHKNSRTLLLDLYERSAVDEIVSQCNGKAVDVIIAGPPCQGFSLTGTRKKDDKRNSLFNAVFDVAERLSPKALVIENVPGIVNLYNGETKESIMTRCDQLGYSCNAEELFAPDFGVPQIRKRVFFVAIKKELGNFEFPLVKIDSDKYVTCEQAIGDLPSLEKNTGSEEIEYQSLAMSTYQKKMREHSSKLLNHTGTNHTEHVINVISQVPEGGNYKDLPPGVGDSRKFNEAWTRYHSQKPSKTIDTGHRNHFHYKWNRVPTVRENARLQSFPDQFVFLGTKTQQYRQVGNAVPPLLGNVIALSLKKYIK